MSLGTTPAADLVVDAPLVQALLRAQHPDLADLALVKVAEGWDNAIFRLGDDLAVRLPKRAVATTLVEHEQRWLPHLAPRLPVPVPVPVRVGVPSPAFGRPWSVVPWLPGEGLLRGPAPDPIAVAVALRAFLRALHQPTPADAPRSPWRGVPLAERVDAFREHLQQVDGLVDRAAALELWTRAIAAPPWPGPPVWIHGDLHPDNVLVSDGRLAGVIDFGDMTSGDPATDLSVRWMLPPAMRAAFEAAAPGDEPEASTLRARGWALALGVAYLAHARDDADLAALGRTTIEAALSEPGAVSAVGLLRER